MILRRHGELAASLSVPASPPQPAPRIPPATAEGLPRRCCSGSMPHRTQDDAGSVSSRARTAQLVAVMEMNWSAP